MQLRTQVAATIGLAAIVWIGTLFLMGEPLSWRMLTPFGATVTAVSTASVLFVHFVALASLQEVARSETRPCGHVEMRAHIQLCWR
jgi:hypothetical protein